MSTQMGKDRRIAERHVKELYLTLPTIIAGSKNLPSTPNTPVEHSRTTGCCRGHWGPNPYRTEQTKVPKFKRQRLHPCGSSSYGSSALDSRAISSSDPSSESGWPRLAERGGHGRGTIRKATGLLHGPGGGRGRGDGSSGRPAAKGGG